MPHMDALSELTGLHRHVVDFLFLALASERLREKLQSGGPDGRAVLGHHRRPKIQAHRVPRRIRHLGHIRRKLVPVFYTMHRFKLGRLRMRPYTSPATRP